MAGESHRQNADDDQCSTFHDPASSCRRVVEVERHVMVFFAPPSRYSGGVAPGLFPELNGMNVIQNIQI
jgi:hypothetical protein